MNLTFFVTGTPKPGGSKSAFAMRRKDGSIITRPDGTPIINVVDAGGKAGKDWRKVVAEAGKRFMKCGDPYTFPIRVSFVFYMARPKAHYRTGKFKHLLREDAPVYHTQTPDALKLARSTEDALTRIVWKDDAQNVSVTAKKEWASISVVGGCSIFIEIIQY